MIEKRFKLSRVTLNNPNAIRDNKEPLTQKEVVDLLNKQHEENQKLKQSNCGLKSELQIFKGDVIYSNKIINKLNDENEELKIRCGDGEQIIRDLKKENKKLKQRVEQLENHIMNKLTIICGDKEIK